MASTTISFDIGPCDGCCAPVCPPDGVGDTIEIVFSLVADPCFTICTPTTQQPGFWFKGLSFPLSGGHTLTRSGPGEFSITLPAAFEYNSYPEDDCSTEPGGSEFADIIISVTCDPDGDGEGKHFKIFGQIFNPAAGGFQVFELYNLANVGWFSAGDEVALPGPCGGSFVVSV